MNNSSKIIFNSREPIGSSTYPMPNNQVNYAEHLKLLSTSPSATNKISTLYIHIPFCDQICSFCGFNKFVSTSDKKKFYVEALLKEMALYSNLKYIQDSDIQAVYIGGGTPNSLNTEQLNTILSALKLYFPLSENCQITCEGTPQNFTDEMCDMLKFNAVTRISAGIQTMNEAIRKEHLHMKYSENEIFTFIERIKNNFDDFNLDFIYNLPNQNEKIWGHDLDVALNSGSSHLTIYPLVLLEKTAFYTDYVKLGKKEIPSEEKEIEFFNTTLKRMESSDYVPYTIRDWAKQDKSCKYITLNAECNNVIALGAGSHGYIANTTYRNEKNIEKYCAILNHNTLPIDAHKICSDDQIMQRFMVMGLRLFKLDMENFNKRFNQNWQSVFGDKIEKLIFSGYLNLDNNIISHTYEGHIWANNIRTYFETEKITNVGYSDSIGIDKTGKSHYDTISRVKASADVEAHS